MTPGNEAAEKQLAAHAVPWLHKAGYVIHIDDDVWDPVAYTAAVTARLPHTAPTPPPAVRAAERPAGARRP